MIFGGSSQPNPNDPDMEVIITSPENLRRIVSDALRTTLPRLLSDLKPVSSTPKEWLTNREAMDFLGLSKTTLQRYRASGRLPYSKLEGSIYYRYADLVAVLETVLRRRDTAHTR